MRQEESMAKQESGITVETGIASAVKETKNNIPSTYILLVLLFWAYFVSIT